jgi:hypothetical protein
VRKKRARSTSSQAGPGPLSFPNFHSVAASARTCSTHHGGHARVDAAPRHERVNRLCRLRAGALAHLPRLRGALAPCLRGALAQRPPPRVQRWSPRRRTTRFGARPLPRVQLCHGGDSVGVEPAIGACTLPSVQRLSPRGRRGLGHAHSPVSDGCRPGGDTDRGAPTPQCPTVIAQGAAARIGAADPESLRHFATHVLLPLLGGLGVASLVLVIDHEYRLLIFVDLP